MGPIPFLSVAIKQEKAGKREGEKKKSVKGMHVVRLLTE
jgi:hypothetical protein